MKITFENFREQKFKIKSQHLLPEKFTQKVLQEFKKTPEGKELKIYEKNSKEIKKLITENKTRLRKIKDDFHEYQLTKYPELYI